LVSLFFLEPFSGDCQPTQELIWRCEPVVIGERSVFLRIGDFSGLDAPETFFRAERQLLNSGTTGVVLLVYDMTDHGTFKNIQRWLAALHRLPEMQANGVRVFVVGNKTDLISEPIFTSSSGRRPAEKSRLRFFNVSAKTGSNIAELRQAVIDTSLDSPTAAVDARVKPRRK
jgi:50S ribosomal subunit-associated GTPase HflX